MIEKHDMEEHPNATLIRGLFAAFRKTDLAAIQNVISDTTIWHFPGRKGLLQGAHQGHAGILKFLGGVSELTDGTFSLELEDVLANDSYAVAFFTGHGRRKDRTLKNPTCLKIQLRDGQATEIWEFVWDLFEVDDFWS